MSSNPSIRHTTSNPNLLKDLLHMVPYNPLYSIETIPEAFLFPSTSLIGISAKSMIINDKCTTVRIHLSNIFPYLRLG